MKICSELSCRGFGGDECPCVCNEKAALTPEVITRPSSEGLCFSYDCSSERCLVCQGAHVIGFEHGPRQLPPHWPYNTAQMRPPCGHIAAHNTTIGQSRPMRPRPLAAVRKFFSSSTYHCSWSGGDGWRKPIKEIYNSSLVHCKFSNHQRRNKKNPEMAKIEPT